MVSVVYWQPYPLISCQIYDDWAAVTLETYNISWSTGKYRLYQSR